MGRALPVSVLLTLVALIATSSCGGEADVHTILVTGFGPFGDHETNPSWEAIRDLDGTRVGGATVRTARLDVVWARAADQLAHAVRATGPDAIVCLGVAPDDRIRLEVVARNRDLALLDVEGERREARPIRPAGPDLLPTRLPVHRMREALEAGAFEHRMSEDAGGYLCNHVFFRLVDELAGDRPAGFVHVPVLGGAWTLDRLRAAVVRLLEVVEASL